MAFKDHFSQQASSYAKYRPTYPLELFEFLASLTKEKTLAWDCACGNGQAATELAAYFKKVVATDPSAKQILNAPRRKNIEYRVEKAESSSLMTSSVDLLVVAQALHWFDFDKFFVEAKRVMKPGSIFAAWAYPLISSHDSKINLLLHNFYHNVLWQGGYWPKERAHIDNAYANIPFPFEPVLAPKFEIKLSWTLTHLLGYIGTWSAVKKYIIKQGRDPIETHLKSKLLNCWGNPEELKDFFTPLILKLGRS